MDEVILDILTQNTYQLINQSLFDLVPPRPLTISNQIFSQTATGAAITIENTEAEGNFSALNAGTHTLNVVNVTETSLTFNVTFPTNHRYGNIVEYLDWASMTWIDATGRGYNAINGTYTISNLLRGSQIILWSGCFDSINGIMNSEIYRHARLAIPPQVLVNHTRSSVDFALDRALLEVMGAGISSRFMDATNQAYYILHDLVGGPRPPRMRIESTRSLPWAYEGEAGWPILWQTTEPSGEGVVAISYM